MANNFDTFFSPMMGETERNLLKELSVNYRDLMKKMAVTEGDKVVNEKELDEHPATVAMYEFLKEKGYTATQLDLAGFPALGFVIRRVEGKNN